MKRMLLFGLVLLSGVGCQQKPPPPDVVARVGQAYLTRDELSRALQLLPVQMDSTEASQQVIEQWITNQLLYQEALRRGLRDDPEVQRLLEENERSVLISALLDRIYQEEEASTARQPDPSEVQAYYERYKEQLRLREPYVRVRYLHTTRAQDARTVHQTLQEAEAVSDSLWDALVARYADNPEEARLLASRYFPESRLFTAAVLTPLREALQRLRNGELASLIEIEGHYHVLQLVERLPIGTIPELRWIYDEVAHQARIQARKQIYARLVQRLRNEARVRGELELYQQ
ncbi:peptidylprolyl isomerase [Rhodothermus profundi]|uniref:Parvulin-like peptidyl-prolyl isomerase n=1 Tax=Rhodothermus profundi TaxID=633813 RepID=A0A1M6SHC2_9BACT|nr:peptidylprolyl isomerase [Rhodothermus profundi]SHK44141.1 Parvulin-like peptidyl-prolyl isomerase [Rhodothermus profundi]